LLLHTGLLRVRLLRRYFVRLYTGEERQRFIAMTAELFYKRQERRGAAVRHYTAARSFFKIDTLMSGGFDTTVPACSFSAPLPRGYGQAAVDKLRKLREQRRTAEFYRHIHTVPYILYQPFRRTVGAKVIPVYRCKRDGSAVKRQRSGDAGITERCKKKASRSLRRRTFSVRMYPRIMEAERRPSFGSNAAEY